MNLNFIILFIIMFFVACSPKYEVQKTYDASNMKKLSINKCEKHENKCQIFCHKIYNQCLSDAQIRAEKLLPIYNKEYQKKLQQFIVKKNYYDRQYQIWINKYEDIKFDYQYYHSKCDDKNDKTYECQKRDYLKAKLERHYKTKPSKPWIVNQITLDDLVTQEESKCILKCDCQSQYDRCFLQNGGKITYKRFCIENCKDD